MKPTCFLHSMCAPSARSGLAMLLIIGCLSAAALAQTPTAPPRYAQLDYIKMEPGKNAEYVANERKYYKPLWQAAVDAGAMRGWAVWGVAC